MAKAKAGKRHEAQVGSGKDFVDEVVVERSKKNPKFKKMVEGKKVKVKKVCGVKGMLEAAAGKKVTLEVTTPKRKGGRRVRPPLPIVVRVDPSNLPPGEYTATTQPDISRGEAVGLKEVSGESYLAQAKWVEEFAALQQVMEARGLAPVDAAKHLIYGHTISTLLERASDPGKLTVPQQAETFTGLTEMFGTFDKALKAFKEVVKAKIVAEGEPFGEHGTGKALHVDGWTWPVTPHTPAGTLDDKKVEAMLRAKGLSPEIFMDREVVYKANRAKLEAEAAIFPEDIANCEKKPVWSLQAPRKAADKGQAERVSTLGVDAHEGEEG